MINQYNQVNIPVQKNSTKEIAHTIVVQEFTNGMETTWCSPVLTVTFKMDHIQSQLLPLSEASASSIRILCALLSGDVTLSFATFKTKTQSFFIEHYNVFPKLIFQDKQYYVCKCTGFKEND